MSYSGEKDPYQGDDYISPVLAKKLDDAPQLTMRQQRKAALDELDNAAFSRYHVKAVAVACIGFLTDAYDIFAISMAATMIGYVYGNGGKNSANQDLLLKVAHSIGTFIGQLLFGWLADRLGRKKMYGLELMIIIVGTLGTAVAGKGSAVSIYGVLVMWRFIMGLGIGGDYPLSATISAEFAGTRIRGRMMTATFAGQGWGNLLAAIVGLCVTVGFKNHIINDTAGDHKYVDICWRILLGFGAVPALLALYFRLTISETPRYTLDVKQDVGRATADVQTFLASGTYEKDEPATQQRIEAPKATWKDFCQHFGQWKNGKVLLGTSLSWFVLDVAFYGLGLNTSIILTTIGFGAPTTGSATEKIAKNLENIAIGNIILSVGGLVPGYWATFFLIDKWGRKPIQLMGFVLLTAIFCVMGFGYNKLQSTTAGKHAFVALYCFANFFQNFGPNTTTFVIPGEVFPTRYRSTAHGISAASGKLGAIIAQVGFARMIDIGGATGKHAFLPHILQIFALFMLIGVFTTLLIPEPLGRSLEDLSGENDEDEYENNKSL